MLFLWTTTKLGKIWIDGDAVKQIIARRLPQELYVQEVSFIGEKALLNIYIAAPDDWPAAERAALEAKFSGLFGPSGVSVQINWVNVAPQDNRKATPVWMLPVFWGAAAAGVTALFHMGLGGVLARRRALVHLLRGDRLRRRVAGPHRGRKKADKRPEGTL